MKILRHLCRPNLVSLVSLAGLALAGIGVGKAPASALHAADAPAPTGKQLATPSGPPPLAGINPDDHSKPAAPVPTPAIRQLDIPWRTDLEDTARVAATLEATLEHITAIATQAEAAVALLPKTPEFEPILKAIRAASRARRGVHKAPIPRKTATANPPAGKGGAAARARSEKARPDKPRLVLVASPGDPARERAVIADGNSYKVIYLGHSATIGGETLTLVAADRTTAVLEAPGGKKIRLTLR